MVAAKNGNLPIVKLLLKHGANMSLKSKVRYRREDKPVRQRVITMQSH